MPAGFCIGVAELVSCYLAMKYKNIRTYLGMGGISVSIIACCLLWQLPEHDKGARLFSVYILSWFAIGYIMLMSLQIANTAGYTKRSLSSSGVFVGYCLGWSPCSHVTLTLKLNQCFPGNFVGPLVFKSTQAPGYHTGKVSCSISNTKMVDGLRLDHYCRHVGSFPLAHGCLPTLLCLREQAEGQGKHRRFRPCI